MGTEAMTMDYARPPARRRIPWGLGWLCGVVIPTLYWCNYIWFRLPPTLSAIRWARSAQVPEWAFLSGVPWAFVLVSVVTVRRACWRLWLGPGMLVVAVAGKAALCYECLAVYSVPTASFVLSLTMGILLFDAIPASLVVGTGLLLVVEARRQARKGEVG